MLVALVILSVMGAGFLRYGGQQAQEAQRLTDKTLAAMVASNVIAQARLATELPQPGQTQQRIAMGGQEWQVTMQVAETAIPTMRRLEVSVAPLTDPSSPVTLIGFTGKN